MGFLAACACASMACIACATHNESKSNPRHAMRGAAHRHVHAAVAVTVLTSSHCSAQDAGRRESGFKGTRSSRSRTTKSSSSHW